MPQQRPFVNDMTCKYDGRVIRLEVFVNSNEDINEVIQSCEHEYRVQMSWSMARDLMTRAKAAAYVERATGAKVELPERSDAGSYMDQALSFFVKHGTIHYGDPPCFRSGCTSGATMNCWDLRVLEFWSRNRSDRRYQEAGGDGEWLRLADHEIELPDARDPERTTGVPHHPCPKCKKLVADWDGFGVLAHVAPMPDACGYCTHPSISDGVCGLCNLAMVSDHEYLSSGDVPSASGDRPYTGCYTCGRSRKEHMRP